VCVEILQQAVRTYRYRGIIMLSSAVIVRSKSGCNVPSWYKKMKDTSVCHSEMKRDK